MRLASTNTCSIYLAVEHFYPCMRTRCQRRSKAVRNMTEGGGRLVDKQRRWIKLTLAKTVSVVMLANTVRFALLVVWNFTPSYTIRVTNTVLFSIIYLYKIMITSLSDNYWLCSTAGDILLGNNTWWRLHSPRWKCKFGAKILIFMYFVRKWPTKKFHQNKSLKKQTFFNSSWFINRMSSQ